MRVLGLQPSHLLLIRTNLGCGTVSTAACARQGCSDSGLVFGFLVFWVRCCECCHGNAVTGF
jgi:hypothetical protein